MYKIIHEGKVIDVVRNPSFIRFLTSGHIAITDKSSAEGIVGSDTKTVYSFTQMSDQAIKMVSIDKINLNEFNRLHSLLNSDNATHSELLNARESKIKILSDICKTKIIDGFTVVLKDQNKYNFRLTTEDQINLLSLENQLNSGVESFVYHSTGLPCRVFIREDMKKIIKTYRKHVLYHTTYFNVAKQYIGALSDIDKIKSFSYGTNLAGYTKDQTLRQILMDGGID